jgi:hypothetical protein
MLYQQVMVKVYFDSLLQRWIVQMYLLQLESLQYG